MKHSLYASDTAYFKYRKPDPPWGVRSVGIHCQQVSPGPRVRVFLWDDVMNNAIKMTGRRFERLTVVAFGEHKKYPCGSTGYMWLCECDCGKKTTVEGRALRAGITKSCGCLTSDVTRARSTKHGHAKRGNISPEYYSWSAMMQRCLNPKSDSYYLYGARGITICERWRDIHEFIKDMGPRPGPQYSLDRIDNNKGYTPGNMRWALSKNQANNRRNNRLIEYHGKLKSIQNHCDEHGVGRGAFQSRILNGWSVDKALSTPVKKYKQRAVVLRNL